MNDETKSTDESPSRTSEPVLPDLYAARVTGTRETFAKLMQQFEVDIGCRRPHVEVNPDGSGTMLLYATKERIGELQTAGYRVEQGENVSALGRERQAEVGEGDRFKGGRVAPRGLGQKPGRGKGAQ